MAYDLALNRITHDLEFEEIVVTAANPSIWDGGQSTWDNNQSIWDSNQNIAPKYSIWAIEGQDRVAQQIKINLLSFLGEWFLDTTYGVPYLEDILIKNPRMAVAETIFRQHIASVPDVIRVDSLAVDWNRQKRTLVVEFSCTTNLGPIADSVMLGMLPRV
jgi:hypothetical protein